METIYSDSYIEVHCKQENHTGERICGDVFVSKKIKEERRIIAVLSDGMGHGVKANILATLTSTMAMNFTKEHQNILKIADVIMNTLPVCSNRKISYSTFTIIDIEQDGQTHILEYDNPQCTVLRKDEPLDVQWSCVVLNNEMHKGKELKACSFFPQKEDRILFFSDGVTQSGLGTPDFPFGWGIDKVIDFCSEHIQRKPHISAHKLSSAVIKRAAANDNYKLKDDTSCGVIYFRRPRKLLICTGPPFDESNDGTLARKFSDFDGRKIISGATTADIVSRELNRKIVDTFDFLDPDLPPMSHMNGAEFITEGILTLEKVHQLLQKHDASTSLGKGPADSIVKQLLKSDEIYFIIGTKINVAHQDPNLPIGLEMRRTVVNRIARVLEDKFLKDVELEFL